VKVFDAGKTRMTGLPYGENYDDILSRFHLIPERYGRTDRQTDRFAISISRVSMLTRDKNYTIYTRLIIFVFLPFAKINKHSAVSPQKVKCAAHLVNYGILSAVAHVTKELYFRTYISTNRRERSLFAFMNFTYC